MWLKRTLIFAAFIAIPGTSFAQIARMEVLSFQSLTMSDQSFLTGSKEGKPVTIAGELRLPRSGTDRLPAIILVHGSGGISGYVTDWEQEFNAMGVATFVIDSWSGRGVTTVVFDQSQLGRLTQLYDVYRALEILEMVRARAVSLPHISLSTRPAFRTATMKMCPRSRSASFTAAQTTTSRSNGAAPTRSVLRPRVLTYNTLNIPALTMFSIGSHCAIQRRSKKAKPCATASSRRVMMAAS